MNKPTGKALRAAIACIELIRGDGQVRLIRDSEVAEIIDLETNLPALIEAAQDFVDKVDQGRAKSTDSYAKFKAALKLL